MPHSITPAAVNLEALDADAKRPAKRWRRTCGIQTGAVFKARAAAHEADPAHVAEGYCDALTLALAPWCRQRCRLRDGRHGRAATPASGPPRGDRRRTSVIHADGDKDGRKAAEHARHEIEATGRRCRVEWYADDPAETLAAWLRERAACREYEGGAEREAAERGAWTDLLQERADARARIVG